MFGNQTQWILEAYQREYRLRTAIMDVAAKLPLGMRDTPDIAQLLAEGRVPATTIFHLGYRVTADMGGVQKAFSYAAEAALAEHWQAGERDLQAALRLLEATPANGLSIHTIHV